MDSLLAFLYADFLGKAAWIWLVFIGIVVTLLGALKKYGLRRGVASLCIGGGEATAMAVELL